MTYVRAGQRDRARQLVAEIMALHDAAPDQMVQPQYLLWAAAQAYQASGDLSHAAELLQRAYTSLQQRAAAIPDAESQTTFLVLSFNRQLLDAHDHDLWPEYCR